MVEVDGGATSRSDQVRAGEAGGDRLTKIALGKVVGRDKVMAAAAIPEVIKSPTRASPRLKETSNEDTMAKVSKRAAERALDVEGNIPSHSFTVDFFPAVDAANVLKHIGLSSGSSHEELEQSVLELFNFDKDRRLLGGDSEDGVSFDQEAEEENESFEELEREAIRNLCGDLVDEVFDEDAYHLSSDTRKLFKNVKSNAKSCKKTCKVRRQKNMKRVLT